MFVWLEFVACSALIVFSGSRLSRYGDVIAEKSGLGRTWIGLVLMATITSLPELITGVSSVAIVDVPDIALGDIMGSCMYNLAILALMDILDRRKPIFLGASRGHILSASFGILLIGIAVISIFLNEYMPSMGHIGLYTPVIIGVYLVGIRVVYFFEKRAMSELLHKAKESFIYVEVPLKRAILMYTVNALIIVGSATWLPFIADRLAEETGLGRTFMGSVFVAMTTSLPEVVVSVAAVMIGAHDLAIGNMFGSNMFNILVLAVDDIFYTKGPIFSHISINHVMTGMIAIVMTSIAVIALTYPPQRKKTFRVGWDTFAIIIVWVVGILLLYITRMRI